MRSNCIVPCVIVLLKFHVLLDCLRVSEYGFAGVVSLCLCLLALAPYVVRNLSYPMLPAAMTLGATIACSAVEAALAGGFCGLATQSTNILPLLALVLASPAMAFAVGVILGAEAVVFYQLDIRGILAPSFDQLLAAREQLGVWLVVQPIVTAGFGCLCYFTRVLLVNLIKRDSEKQAKLIEDIRRQALSHLLEKNTFQLIIDSIPLFVYWKDCDGHLMGCNSRFATLIRKPNIGTRVAGLRDDELDLEPSTLAFIHSIHSFDPKAPAAVVARQDEVLFEGALCTLSHSSVPLYPSPDHLLGVLVTFDDVTVAREKERAQSRIEMHRMFLANMSHELRTPLNGVLGMTQQLLTTPLDENQALFCKTIMSCGTSLRELVDDVLAVSKLENAEQTKLESIDFNLLELIESAFDPVIMTGQCKGLELITELSPSLPAVVTGDPARIKQVLFNLCSNAVKFTSEGQVLLRVSSAEDLDERKLVLRFEMEDSGIGIDENARSILFQPFSQADKSTTRKYGGSGLGLVISRRLAELMGGSIDFRSTLGVGTTFIFTARVRLPPRETPKIFDPLPLQRVSGKRVIVAARNQKLLGSLVRMLRCWGMIAYPASSYAEIPEAVVHASGRIDRVVCGVDLADGGLDGFFELCKTSAVPVIALLTFDAVALAPRLLRKGATAHLVKPVKMGLLAKALSYRPSAEPMLDLSLIKTEEKEPRDMYGATRSVYRRLYASRHFSVMVVDDVEANCLVAETLLKSLGVAAVLVNSGAEAVRRAAEVQLMFVDCYMPELDGFTATRLIREAEAASGRSKMAIIAVTGLVSEEDVNMCTAAGMQAHLSKPLMLGRVAEVLHQYLPNYTRALARVTRETMSFGSSIEQSGGGDGLAALLGKGRALKPGSLKKVISTSTPNPNTPEGQELLAHITRSTPPAFTERKLEDPRPETGARDAREYTCGDEEQLPSLAEGSSAAATVLLVDDDPINLMVLGLMVERLGYSYHCAGGGVEGVRMALENDYKVVLTDCHMPEINGYDLTERVLAEKPFLPVVAVSADATASNQKRCLELGMVGFVSKPVSVSALEAIMRRCALPPGRPSETAGATRSPAEARTMLHALTTERTRTPDRPNNTSVAWAQRLATMQPHMLIDDSTMSPRGEPPAGPNPASRLRSDSDLLTPAGNAAFGEWFKQYVPVGLALAPCFASQSARFVMRVLACRGAWDAQRPSDSDASMDNSAGLVGPLAARSAELSSESAGEYDTPLLRMMREHAATRAHAAIAVGKHPPTLQPEPPGGVSVPRILKHIERQISAGKMPPILPLSPSRPRGRSLSDGEGRAEVDRRPTPTLTVDAVPEEPERPAPDAVPDPCDASTSSSSSGLSLSSILSEHEHALVLAEITEAPTHASHDSVKTDARERAALVQRSADQAREDVQGRQAAPAAAADTDAAAASRSRGEGGNKESEGRGAGPGDQPPTPSCEAAA